MAKKRKSVATRLDEVDRTMYTTFCSAANSLSQLYTQAMNQQKLSFQAGERNAMEKMYEWILRQQQDGARVTTTEILAYLQNELDYGGEEAPASFHQHTQPAFMNPSVQVSSASYGTAVGQAPRSVHSDQQTKNTVFSNALSSPVRRSLQHCQLAQGGYYPSTGLPSANGARNTETNSSHQQNRESNSISSNDLMDMHADSPGHSSY